MHRQPTIVAALLGLTAASCAHPQHAATAPRTPPAKAALPARAALRAKPAAAATPPQGLVIRQDASLAARYCPSRPHYAPAPWLSPPQARLGARAVAGALAIYQAGRRSVFPDVEFAHGAQKPIYLQTNIKKLVLPPGPLMWVFADSEQKAANAAEVAQDETSYAMAMIIEPTRGQGVVLRFRYTLHLSRHKRQAGAFSLFGHWRQYCIYLDEQDRVVYVPFGAVIMS